MKAEIFSEMPEQNKEIRICRIENRSLLEIGTETIEVDDYQLKSSANGCTELTVKIMGTANVIETSANLIMKK